jgi:hypothetical protein
MPRFLITSQARSLFPLLGLPCIVPAVLVEEIGIRHGQKIEEFKVAETTEKEIAFRPSSKELFENWQIGQTAKRGRFGETEIRGPESTIEAKGHFE